MNGHALGIPLPLEIEEITPEFLRSALSHRFPGVVVRHSRIIDIRHGFTTVIRVQLDADPQSHAAGLPHTVIVKGGFEPFTRQKARNYSVLPMSMEVQSYRTLQPELGLNMPVCYFSQFDPDREQMIIIMEDLTARNVTFGHGLIPYTPQQVRRRLTSIAAFHAKTWGSPDLKVGGRWSIFPSNGSAMFRAYMDHAGYTASGEWQRYVAMPRGAAVSNQFHDFKWMMLALDYMSRLGEELPNCVVHGDLHLGNLYEEPDGTPGFFDALPRREPPMAEVSYHITNVLDPADRRRCDRELVAYYRDELIRNGIDAPDLDDFMYQFAVFLPIGFITFMVNESSYQTESFNTAHAARYGAAMLDHNTKALTRQAMGAI